MYDLGGPLADLRVPSGTNLLVVGPPLSGKRRLGFELLARGVAGGEVGIVLTNTDGEPAVRDAIAARTDERAAGLGVVDCVSRHRGVETTGNAIYASSPDDLTGAGIGLSEQLQSLGERDVDGVRVLVSTISALLVYSSVETTFRFLHVCTSRIENAGGLGLHLLEDGVHEAAAMGTVTQLYDGVVRTSHDDPPEVVTAPPGATPV